MWGCWCDLLLSCCCSKAKRIACSRTCLLTCSAPQAGKFGFEMQMRSAARSRDGGSSGAPACARRPRWRFFSCSAAAALLFVPISASRLPTNARASGRPVASSRDRENQQCSASKSLLVFLLISWKKLFFLAQPCPAPQALKNMGPSARAEVLRVLHCSACLRRLPAGSRRPAGAVPQAPSARRRREIFRGGAGGGRFGGQGVGQGRNMAFLVTLFYCEISSRRVDRVPCWGVNSAVFGVQWGAFRLAEPPVLSVVVCPSSPPLFFPS